MRYRFYVPTNGADDWKQGLADPEKQWQAGYSAYAMAHAWEDAKGFPHEVKATFKDTVFEGCDYLIGLPEHKVPMPAEGADSQNDLFVLAKTLSHDLVSMSIEGKVSEDFGPKLATWNTGSQNKTARLYGILDSIGLPHSIPNSTRYQLLHRTASAMLEAQRFNAKYALMLVHSFSQMDAHFDDYDAFVKLYGIASITVGELVKLTTVKNIHLYTMWVRGNQKYLKAQS